MKRTSREIADEILRRAGMLAAKRRKRVYSIVAIAAGFVLTAGLSFALPPSIIAHPSNTDGTLHAALFADGATGGYVLVGVLGFVLGAVITIICFKKSKRD